jgi:hypothetical protein
MDSFNDIKKRSKALFQSASMDTPSETTPREITSDVRAFAAQLGNELPRRIPVQSDNYGVYGWCSNGVLEKMKHAGGSIVFGWTIWEWPGDPQTADRRGGTRSFPQNSETFFPPL